MSRDPSTTELFQTSESDAFEDVLVVAFGAPEAELGRRFPIGEELSIGRGSPHFAYAPKTVSRRHALAKREGGRLMLHDQASRQGTFVNGQRIQSRALGRGDVVLVGGLGLIVTSAPTRFVPKPTPPLAFWSWAMARVIDEVRAAAKTRRPLALIGEPGVGKGMLAALAAREAAESGALVAIDAASSKDATWPTTNAPGENDTVLFARMSEAAEPVIASCIDLIRRRERGEPAPRVIIALSAAADEPAPLPEGLVHYFEGSCLRVPALAERSEDTMPIAYQRLRELANTHVAIGPAMALRLLRRRFAGNVRSLLGEVERAWARGENTRGDKERAAQPLVVDDLPGEPQREVAVIANDASFLESAHGERTSLERRRVLRGILSALLAARDSKRPLASHELSEAGWPGERMTESSASNRVYVAIATLRKLGLARALVSSEDGYRLEDDSLLRVVVPAPATE